MGDQRQRNTGQ